jgi:hypothetical protein
MVQLLDRDHLSHPVWHDHDTYNPDKHTARQRLTAAAA